MSHYILPGGPFARAFAKLAASGFQLRWQSLSEDQSRTAKRASKTKYVCHECEQNAWAKPDALLICGRCYEEDDGEIHLMIAESFGRKRSGLNMERMSSHSPPLLISLL